MRTQTLEPGIGPTTTRANAWQEIQFDKLALTAFNKFDGSQVAEDLTKHPDLWDAVFVPERQVNKDLSRLLREIAGGDAVADTVYILTDTQRLPTLLIFAHTWGYDEALYTTSEESRSVSLQLWWD